MTTIAATNGKTPEVQEDGQPSYRLKRLARVQYTIPIRGTAPLIVNRWSEKAKAMMLTSQQSKAKPKRPPKDPYVDFEASRYRMPDGRDGFPAPAFKAAIVWSARLFDKALTQVVMKQAIIVGGEGPDQLVPIVFGEVTMREDTPRNSGGTADLRYRAQFWPWSAVLTVICVEGQFDNDSVVALVDAAGIGGVGEWRPTSPKSATGTYGTFEVVEES